ncbi:putative hydrolase of the HAD superfamily [Neobacillus niacini]|nr:putative hydrolase of the HAD superfamily [Neobacillus niacini]
MERDDYVIKGVIFDFDGLIVDTESVWFEALKEVLMEKHHVELELSKYSSCIGTGSDVLFKYLRGVVGEDVDCELLNQLALEKYNEKMKQPSLREGVIEYLEEAKINNLKIGLASCSSREWVARHLKPLNIIEYFDVINTKNDVKKVKPDPEIYIKTLTDCNLKRPEAVAFEDSLNGLLAAKEAGIRCVIVPNDVTRHLSFETHDYKLETMSQEALSEVIKKLI